MGSRAHGAGGVRPRQPRHLVRDGECNDLISWWCAARVLWVAGSRTQERLGGTDGCSQETQEARSPCCRAVCAGGRGSRRVCPDGQHRPGDGELGQLVGRIQPARDRHRLPDAGEAHPHISGRRPEVPGQVGPDPLGCAVRFVGRIRPARDRLRLPGVGEAHPRIGDRRPEVPG